MLAKSVLFSFPKRFFLSIAATCPPVKIIDNTSQGFILELEEMDIFNMAAFNYITK